MSEKLPIGLYIHYPWCIRKCPYCDFNSYPKKNSSCSDEGYLDTLLSDFENSKDYIDSRKFLSVYIGGGTPSLFSPFLMEKIFKTISPYIDENTEISMEANPGTVTLDLLKDYKSIGLNRISLGVQSFNDNSLKALGRIHDSKTAIESCQNVIKAGFTNFNIDIMHGLPHQNTAKALDDLKQAFLLGCNHLSWYELTLEEDTYFGEHPPVLPKEDDLADIEESGFSLIEQAGFKRYEVSGYTKDKRCLHNQNYWMFGDYLGIGAGAHSKIRLNNTTYRRANEQKPLDYRKQIEHKDALFLEVDKDNLPFEFMLNRLRIFDPIRFDEFEKTTGLDFDLVKSKLEDSKNLGLLEFTKDTYYLTQKGKWMLNDILEMFL